MNALAAIGVAGLIAVAGLFWFSANPNVVVEKVQPMKPSPDVPTFGQVRERLR